MSFFASGRSVNFFAQLSRQDRERESRTRSGRSRSRSKARDRPSGAELADATRAHLIVLVHRPEVILILVLMDSCSTCESRPGGQFTSEPPALRMRSSVSLQLQLQLLFELELELGLVLATLGQGRNERSLSRSGSREGSSREVSSVSGAEIEVKFWWELGLRNLDQKTELSC